MNPKKECESCIFCYEEWCIGLCKTIESVTDDECRENYEPTGIIFDPVKEDTDDRIKAVFQKGVVSNE